MEMQNERRGEDTHVEGVGYTKTWVNMHVLFVWGNLQRYHLESQAWLHSPPSWAHHHRQDQERDYWTYCCWAEGRPTDLVRE